MAINAQGTMVVTAISNSTASLTDIAGGDAQTVNTALVTMQFAYRGVHISGAQDGDLGAVPIDSNGTTFQIRLIGPMAQGLLKVGSRYNLRLEPTN